MRAFLRHRKLITNRDLVVHSNTKIMFLLTHSNTYLRIITRLSLYSYTIKKKPGTPWYRATRFWHQRIRVNVPLFLYILVNCALQRLFFFI